ncbi:MAG: hypothetical protein SFW67_30330 [Myxococcaceae bacterium]|nr:hypothetical protein [Myxococcaceae bacterium]
MADLPSVPPPELISRPPGGGIGLIALGSAVASAVATFLPVALAKWQLEQTPAVHDGAVAAPVVGLGCLLAAAVPTLFLVTLATGFKALRTDEYQLGRASLALLVGLALYGALQLSAPKPAVARREGPTDAECAMRAKSGNPCPPASLPEPPPLKAFDSVAPKPSKPDTLRPFKP